jgi:Putative peptidoglycan binding domain/L,D-transpeptidase catalytic domain
MMQSVRRWLISAGLVVAAAAAVCGQVGAPVVAHAATASPAAAPYVPPGHDLFYGDKGAAVRSVQRRLLQLHYYPGPVDGVYGPDMQQAVWAFKEVQGLPMNAYSNSVVTYAFRRALVHPKEPRVLIKHGPASRIEINQNIEVLVLYSGGKPKWILHVSTGGNCLVDQGCGWITPDGNYRALSFLPGWVHVPLGEMYNPVFFIGTAYAIHGDIPVPWFPDSHGCVRIWMDAATWFHKDVTVNPDGHGTPVYIRGTAPYSSLANAGAVFSGA